MSTIQALLPASTPFLAALLLATAAAQAIEFNDKTLAVLKSPLKSERQRFYQILPPLPPEEKKAAVAQMREARAFHKEQALHAVTAAARGENSWAHFLKAHTAWREAVVPLLTTIRTDWHKDAKKIADLTRDAAQCAKLRERVRLAATATEHADYARLLAATEPMLELDQAIADAEGTGASFKQTPGETLALAVAGSEPEAGQVKTLTDWLATMKRYADVEEANAKCRWAKDDQRRFATMLNEVRSVVDLTPLRLDEQLCEASTGHSKEMVALKYFAHDSPVKENKGMGERARNAKFEGFASGECIFGGSRSAAAAYGAWWGSDGHRFVMFSDANTLGIGNNGTDHWTLNTGNKKWP